MKLRTPISASNLNWVVFFETCGKGLGGKKSDFWRVSDFEFRPNVSPKVAFFSTKALFTGFEKHYPVQVQSRLSKQNYKVPEKRTQN